MNNFIKENNQKQQESKIDLYYQSVNAAAQRKAELDAIKEQQIAQKKDEFKQQKQMREEIRLRNQQLEQQRINGFIEISQKKEETIHRVKAKKEIETYEKHNMQVLKQTDKQENVKRIQKMQEYQRDKIMEKILFDNQKAEQIKLEKAELMKTRQALKQEIEKNKQEMIEKFAKVKQGKLDAAEVFQNVEKSKLDSSQNNIVKTEKPEIVKQKPNKNVQPLPQKQEHKQDFSKKMAEQKIEELKLKQNSEMLQMLDEEQEKENKRDQMIQEVTDPTEKQRLEKIFGIERGQVQHKILELSDLHDKQLAAALKKYKLK